MEPEPGLVPAPLSTGDLFTATPLPGGESFTAAPVDIPALKVKYKAKEIEVEQRGGPNGAVILTARLQIKGQPIKVTLNYKSNFKADDAKNDMEEALVKAAKLAKIMQIGTETEKVTVTSDQKLKVTKPGEEEQEFDSVEQGLEKEIETTQGKITGEKVVAQTQFSAAAKISKIQRFIESPPVVQKAAEQHLADFAGNVSKAKRLAKEIEKQEKLKLSFLLDHYTKLYAKLETAKPGEIAGLRDRLQDYSNQLKQAFNEAEKPLFEKLQAKLVAITNEYNAVLDIKLHTPETNSQEHEHLDIQLAHLEQSIQVCNQIIGQTNLTTNPLTIMKSHVMDFGAVVEKKMDLIENQLTAQGSAFKDDKRGPGGKYEKQLKKAPSLEQMQNAAGALQGFFQSDSRELIPASNVKALYGELPELKWGKSHLDKALQTAANWTDIRSVVVKKSAAGRLYAAVVVNEPLLEENQSGAPAGLLKDKKIKRPINLFKTTSYILGRDQKPIGEVVSFRGGQFATVDSAKAAIEAIQNNLPDGVELTELHINSLLTPFYFTSVVKDRTLLKVHKESIEGALKDLRLEIPLTLSNFGVNEGAVGQYERGNITLPAKLGWHTAVGEYDNAAVTKLSESINTRLETLSEVEDFNDPENVAMLDKLGAIYEVGLEMEAIWANNDYADARIGNNQFKMPALWKTMDALLGIPCYTNCKSGKDRTGKVESNAQENLDEIFMNIADQKRLLKEVFTQASANLSGKADHQKVWNEFEAALTSACFTKDEIENLAKVVNGLEVESVAKVINDFIKSKIESIQNNLGSQGGEFVGLIQSKEDVPRGFFNIGVQGIPKTESKRERLRNRLRTPKIAPRSNYDTDMDPKTLVDRQRQAKNRRLSQLTGSLRITQVNTGKPGYKVEGGEPLAQFSSGFDRGYIELLVDNFKPTEFGAIESIFDSLGLYELPPNEADRYKAEISGICRMAQSAKKTKMLLDLMRRIEHDKVKSLAPQVHVST